MHSIPSPHIRFDGDWTPGEQRLLTHAIADAEAVSPPDPLPTHSHTEPA